MCSSYEVILTKSRLEQVKTVHSSENCTKTVRMRMMCFNYTITFYEEFWNINWHKSFTFGFCVDVCILKKVWKLESLVGALVWRLNCPVFCLRNIQSSATHNVQIQRCFNRDLVSSIAAYKNTPILYASEFISIKYIMKLLLHHRYHRSILLIINNLQTYLINPTN